MESRLRSLKLNKKLMFGTRFFIELKTIFAVVQLFYLSRGLSTSQIIYLSLFWSITTFICDLPSSVLADKFGRKKLLMVGIFFISISNVLLFFGHDFWQFVFFSIINAIGYSFATGADTALLYDSLKELGEEGSIRRVSGKYFSAASLPKIIMPLLGSLIAKNLLPWQFAIVIGIDFLGTIVSLILASFLTEPIIKDKVKNNLGILREGFKLVMSDNILLKFALNKSFVFEASFVYWRVYQIVLQNAHMPVIFLGLVYTVFQGIMFLTHWNTEKVQKLVGPVNFAIIPQIVGLVGIILTLVSSNLVVLFVSCIAVILAGTFPDPFFLTQMQARIPSFNRATATSTLHTIKNIIDIPILLLVGYLASINVNYVLIVSAVLFVIPLIFMRIKEEELDTLLK
jgi:MFS family permease